MNTYKITGVFFNDKKKDGTPFKAFGNKKNWRISLRVEGLPDKTYPSRFTTDENPPEREWEKQTLNKQAVSAKLKIWQEGDFWNYEHPSQVDQLEERVAKLEAKVFAKGEPNIPL